MSDLNELNDSRPHCALCGMPADGGVTCSICHRTYCMKHSHMLALTRTKEMNVANVCKDCIDQHHLQVVDSNHPYYLKYKGDH